MCEIYSMYESYKSFHGLTQSDDETTNQFAKRVLNYSKTLNPHLCSKDIDKLSHLQILIGIRSQEQLYLIIKDQLTIEHLINYEITKSENRDSSKSVKEEEVEDNSENLNGYDDNNIDDFHPKITFMIEDDSLRYETDHICKDCGEYFDSSSWLEIHRSVLHSCSICDFTFNCKTKLQDHKADEHQIYECCENFFDSDEELKEHKKTHENLKSCLNCELQFESIKDYQKHLARICEMCNICFRNQKELTRHKATEHRKIRPKSLKVEPQECPICKRTFKSENVFKKHFQQVHEKDKHEFHCHVCTFTASTENILNKHLITHLSESDKLKCEKCDKVFLTKLLLKQHVENHHENQVNYICDYCSKGFYYARKLKEHIESTHLQIKKFACSYCDWKTSHRKSIQVHIRAKHTFIKPHKCPQCDKAFVNRNVMMRHFREAHEGVKNTCNICGAKIAGTGYRNMKRHQMSVHKEFTYKEWEKSVKSTNKS